jgi:nucleoside 2-deoxyribosyltransferase
MRADSGADRGSMVEQVYRHLESADVVIADITHLTSNVMYELGFAHGAKRPVIVISGNRRSCRST